MMEAVIEPIIDLKSEGINWGKFIESNERVIDLDVNSDDVEEKEAEAISEEEFNFAYPIVNPYDELLGMKPVEEKVVGSPFGNYEDKLNFFKWILETKNTRHGASLLKTAVINFGSPITTQFLKNQTEVNPSVTRRINDLRVRAGFRTVPIGYHFKDYTNTKFKTAFTDFGLNSGKISINVNTCSVGRFRRIDRCRLLDKWVHKSEFNERVKRLNELKEKFSKEIENREFRTEITLNNLFSLLEGNEWKGVKDRDMTEKEYKAVQRLRKGQVKTFKTWCEYCKGLIQYPLSPNAESDRYEALAHFIYTCSLNEKEDIVLCKNCLNNIWVEDKILEVIQQLDSKKSYKFPIDKFCEYFRKDKHIVENEVAGKALKKMLKKVGIDREVFIDGNEMIII